MVSVGIDTLAFTLPFHTAPIPTMRHYETLSKSLSYKEIQLS
jgi:hypothetical protein